MPDHITISGINGQEQPSIDVNTLRRLGLDSIIATGSKYWTDYNEHDPGITILEVLVYALTDLGYRTNFPITDILAQQQLSTEELAQSQFYTAREILTVNPLTLLDFRKILVDQEGVDNAWIFPLKNTLEPTRGLLEVVVDDQYEEGSKQRKALRQKLQTVLQKHRNLSQNVGKFSFREPLEFSFKIDLIVDEKAPIEKTIAKSILALEEYLSSTVYFLSFQEMMDKMNGDINAVFSGPPLMHGFLPKEALLPRMEELQAVDLLPIIQQIAGVKGVSSLEFRSTLDNLSRLDELETPSNWFHQREIPSSRKPILAPLSKQIITVRRGDIVEPWTAEGVRIALSNMRSSRRMPKLAAAERDVDIPTGNFRDITAYLTIQSDFPRIYGLPPHDLPHGATVDRKAKVKQLQAYLLFFDQIMANYLAQLAQAGQLFSWSSTVQRTYFFQGLEHAMTNLAELLVGGTQYSEKQKDSADQKQLQALISKYKATLGKLREDEATFLQRRNLFLNHLLARFGRNLDIYTGQLSVAGSSPTTAFALEQAAIDTKQRVLQNYPFLSANRAKGSSVGIDTPHFSHQFSGLRYWVETLFDMVPEDLDVFRFNDRFHLDHYDTQGQANNPASEYVVISADGSDINLQQLLTLGIDPANLQIEAPNIHPGETIPTYRIRIARNEEVTPVGSPVYYVEPIFTTAEAAEEGMAHLCSLFQRYSKTSERVYIVEHFHLRPSPAEPYFGLDLLDTDGTPWLRTASWYSQLAFTGLTDMVQRGCIYYSLDNQTLQSETTSAPSPPPKEQGEETKPSGDDTKPPEPAEPASEQGAQTEAAATAQAKKEEPASPIPLQPVDTTPKLLFRIKRDAKDEEQAIIDLSLRKEGAPVSLTPVGSTVPVSHAVQKIEEWIFTAAPVSFQIERQGDDQYVIKLSMLSNAQVADFKSQPIPEAEKLIQKWTLRPAIATFQSSVNADQKYQVLLQYQNKDISLRLLSTQQFDSAELAQQAAKNWQKTWDKNSTKNYPLQASWKPFLQPWNNPEQVNTAQSPYQQLYQDPFSFILTVVIPKWPVRFQNKGFKEALATSLHREAPAHLWLNLLWLGKIEFQLFQELYGNWWHAFVQNEPSVIYHKRVLLDFIMQHSYEPSTPQQHV